jgi:RimJ/RimL family protein N-acetyltransferase
MVYLETERLIIRKWNVNDANDFYEIDSNPNITIPVGWGVHKDKSKSLKMLNILIKKDSEWAVISKENNKAIGCVGFNFDTLRKASISSRNIIYALNEEYWGRGFCSEAVKCLIKYLFEEMQIEILCGHCFSYNLRSKKVLENCGFTHEGTVRMYEKKKDDIIDYVLYSMTKDEYIKVNLC